MIIITEIQHPERIKYPVMIKRLIFINCIVFVVQIFAGADALRPAALIPLEITTGTDLVGLYEATNGVTIVQQASPVSIYSGLFCSMFIHAGILHLLFNMAGIHIFGPAIETRFGKFKLLVLFISSGIFGFLMHTIANPHSVFPVVGASGALFGLLGAYCVLFPKDVFKMLLFFVIPWTTTARRLILWIVGLELILATTTSSFVAHYAHLGGFVAGVCLAVLFRKFEIKPSEPDFPDHGPAIIIVEIGPLNPERPDFVN